MLDAFSLVFYTVSFNKGFARQRTIKHHSNDSCFLLHLYPATPMKGAIIIPPAPCSRSPVMLSVSTLFVNKTSWQQFPIVCHGLHSCFLLLDTLQSHSPYRYSSWWLIETQYGTLSFTWCHVAAAGLSAVCLHLQIFLFCAAKGTRQVSLVAYSSLILPRFRSW